MRSFSNLKTFFGSLSQNTSATNLTLGGGLINDQYRYIMEKYFDNERTFQISTVGAQNLTLTGSLAINATTATLNAVWPYISCNQFVNFSNGQQRLVQFINNSTTLAWQVGLTATATTAITTVGVRDYPIPANVSKIKNATITIGQLVYPLVPVQTRAEWDSINVLPYTSDIPSYLFVWNGTMGVFPVPSTTGNIISFNHKTRVADLSFADYSTGNITTMTPGSYSVTGTATSWVTTGAYPTGVDITSYNLQLRVDPPFGDGIWYPIQSFQSNTGLTLALPVISAPNITSGSTYTIAQLPILQEDFQDMMVYGALMTYYTAIVPDSNRYKTYEEMYNRRLELLKDYAGTKTVNVDLESEPTQLNSNLYIYKS